ncbi:CBU_0592 family membrane protein [Sphingomonas solaris]|uniref:CBU-0592-like domain-containing protein n=1 Tax=Alterirhizorhabdus solaris TaxID=2529389 RepID=A0A558QTE2_9SPHN|nr:hypothetical protein [Sphingomonas solaris]TVV70327.1 hypothetical protein FOY91_19390 [Sphingomonas solaris]
MPLIVEIAGWAGAGLILIAYVLLSLRRIGAESVIYQGLNVVGSAGFVVNGWAHGALPSVGLNLLWLLVGGWALSRILRARRPGQPVGPGQPPPIA